MSTKSIVINMTDGASYNAGQVGENRAVELFIHVPQDMYSLDHNYRLVFSNGVVTPMLQITPPGNDGEDGVIRYLLESELTSSSSLGMQLEEYGEDGLIDKSSIVNLKFGNSLSKPKEVFFNKDIIDEINNNTLSRHTHSNYELLESITADDLGGGSATDDVVLLPFGVPLDLVFDKPETAHYYLAHENITTNRQFLIEVLTESANRSIKIACYNGLFSIVYDEFGVGKKYYQNGSWDVEPNLSAFTITAVKFNDTSTALSIDEIIANGDYLRMYTSFCQAFQSCAIEDFKRYPPIDGEYEALSNTVVCDGRVCVAKLNEHTTTILASRDRFLGTKDSYATVYVDCDADVDVAFDADYFVGGEVPNTKAGRHKLIYNLLPDCSVSIGALDLEAVV